MQAIRSKFHGKHSRKSLNNEKVLTDTTTTTTTTTNSAPALGNAATYTEAVGDRVVLDGVNSSTLPRDDLLVNNTLVSNNGPILAPTANQTTGLPVQAAPLTSHTEYHNDIGREHIDQYTDKTIEVLPATANRGKLNETITTTSTVSNTNVIEDKSIPLPPPAPAVYQLPQPIVIQRSAPVVSNYSSGNFNTSRSQVFLPTETIEKPAIVHENIRREEVEEIQPVVHVERERTEIRQITQPLFDKEIRPVVQSERVLPIEILPTIERDFVAVPRNLPLSTQTFDTPIRQYIEKAPIVQETERWRIIEEVTPIIYKETIVPHVIKISKPIREVIVEAPIYVEQTLANRSISGVERDKWASFYQPLPPQSFIPSQNFSNPSFGQRPAFMQGFQQSGSQGFQQSGSQGYQQTQSNIPIPPPLPPVYNGAQTRSVPEKQIIKETTTTTTTVLNQGARAI